MQELGVTSVVLLVGLALAAAGALLALVLRGGEPRTSAALIRLQAELQRLARSQEELRDAVQRGREASVSELAATSRELQAQIGQARQTLAEVRALDEGRGRELQRAAESLRRLEAVVAGSASRGMAGENVLARTLLQLPPELIATDVAFGAKVVEYALRLPGGRLLPIDSKWTSAAALSRLAEAPGSEERQRLEEQVRRDVRRRMQELAKYLDPERTLSLGLMAVPDAVHAVAAGVHAEGYRRGVLIVPYSLALPYVLALYHLALRFAPTVDAEQLAGRLHALEKHLQGLCSEIEGRLSRGLVQVDNARHAMREHVATALAGVARLRRADNPTGPAPEAAGDG